MAEIEWTGLCAEESTRLLEQPNKLQLLREVNRYGRYSTEHRGTHEPTS